MGRHSRSLSQTGEMYEDSVLELNSEGVFGALGVASEQLGVFSRFVTSIVSDESNLGLQIYMCAKKGDEKKLSKLVADAKKNDLRYRREPLRDTALHRACDGGNTVCAYILLFAGAKINAKNDNGEVFFCYFCDFFLFFNNIIFFVDTSSFSCSFKSYKYS